MVYQTNLSTNQRKQVCRWVKRDHGTMVRHMSSALAKRQGPTFSPPNNSGLFFRSSQVTDRSFAYSNNCISLAYRSTLGIRPGMRPTLANDTEGAGAFSSGGELETAPNTCALG